MKDGAIWYRTEYEPLGNQEISPYGNEAEFPEPPNTSTDGLKGAEEPQWQCEVAAATGHSFFGAPRHCQIAQLENTRFESFYNKQNSPAQITHEGGAAPRNPDSASDELLSLTLTATSKPREKPKLKTVPKGTPRPPVDENDFEKPLQFGDNTVDGFVEASESGERGLTTKEVKKIADDIQAIFDNNPGCLEFINGIVEMASSATNPVVSQNPLDTFWAVYQQEGFSWISAVKPGEFEAAYAIGKVAKGSAQIQLPPQKTLAVEVAAVSSQKFIRDFNRQKELEVAQNALAEIIHHMGALLYNDREMGIALADYKGIPRPKFGFKTLSDVTKWSSWWHPKVNFPYCKIQNVITNENRRGR